MVALIGMYRKMHIPDDPLYYEKFYFTPGDLGFQNFETRYSRIGVLVCWDQWYPEGARITSLQGANVLFYPTAIGWHPSEKAQYGEAQLDAWRTVQRAHAISNGVFVAAVNRTGFEGPAGKRPRILGQFICGGSVRASDGASQRRQGRSAGRRMRSRSRWTKCGGTGLFCATAASMPTHPSRIAGLVECMSEQAADSASACRPNGSRMRRPGWRGRTKRPTGRVSSSRSLGLWRDRPASCRSRARKHSGRTSEAETSSPKACCEKCGAQIERGRLLSRSRPIAAGRAISARHLSSEEPGSSPCSTGDSMAGLSTRTRTCDDAVTPELAGSIARIQSVRRNTTANALCLKAGAST